MPKHSALLGLACALVWSSAAVAGVPVPGFAATYMEAVWEHEWLQQWIEAAEAEEWVIEQYETPVTA